MVRQPLVLPFTPAATAQVTTPVQLSPGLQLHQQIDGLTRGINTKLPSDMVYPSLGQVGEEAQRVSTFLDLYQSRARDNETLSKVKSPTSREEGA
ncbi:hypothetical protein BDY19DRAFT_976151 [Irpex rosettiformis]|uniref:Uncharacterized protein n=1 Tax=Irpex rosettiformis TaxID=378272 RepID=A0ACB8TNW2_9APHY|nr:hypothetical protein BDY19DRAFT_976151 [Irpex rosettiformis]